MPSLSKFFAFIIGLVAFPVFVIAQAAPGQPGGSVAEPLPLAMLFSIIGAITNAAWYLFAGISIILFLYAGMLFLTAAGDPTKLHTSRQAFLWGVVGVAVMILAFSIFTLVQNTIS